MENLELILALQNSLMKCGIVCFVTTVSDESRGSWKIGNGPNCSGGIDAMRHAYIHAAIGAGLIIPTSQPW